MKIEIYKEDDYALNNLALMLIDNKYDGITGVEIKLLDEDLIGIKNVIEKLVDEINSSDKTYEEFMKDLGE